MRKIIDLTGQVYGCLTVLSLVGRANGATRWLCLCKCGVRKEVSGGNLRSGNTVSCGCYISSVLSSQASRNATHGRTNTKAYRAWEGMKQRCLNPDNPQYASYGGRGITVSQEWLTFSNFLADMGEPAEGLSIDRKNNNLGYSKGNCKWSTREDQSNNKQQSVRVEYRGELKTIAELSKLSGKYVKTLQNRLNNLWSAEDAVSLGRRQLPSNRCESRVTVRLYSEGQTK